MACHHEGVKQHQFKDGRESTDLLVDEMRKIVLAAGLDRDETHLIEDLHPGDEALHKAPKADEEAYAAALKQTFAGRVFGNDPVSVLYNRFKKDVTLETLAAEFGEQDPSFLSAPQIQSRRGRGKRRRPVPGRAWLPPRLLARSVPQDHRQHARLHGAGLSIRGLR